MKFERTDGIALLVALALALLLGICLTVSFEPQESVVFRSESAPLLLVLKGEEIGVTPLRLSQEKWKGRVAAILGVPEESIWSATRQDPRGKPLVYHPGEAILELHTRDGTPVPFYEAAVSYSSETGFVEVTLFPLP